MADVKITIDGRARYIDYVFVEGFKYKPRKFFKIENGNWVSEKKNLPIVDYPNLDIVIVAIGNPGDQCEMTVEINGTKKGPFTMYKPFNRNGYGQFDEDVAL